MANILIIEDNADIAAIERDYLSLAGYDVTIEPDGTRGLQAALTGSFDLLLLDLMLPGTDGFTICRPVREQKKLPILMVSARTGDADKIRGLGFGADDSFPAELVAGIVCGKAAVMKIVNVKLVDILFALVVFIPLFKKLLRNLHGHIEENNAVGSRNAELAVFKIKQPVKERIPFCLRQLCHLVAGVRGGVSVCNNNFSAVIFIAPEFFKACIAVNGKKG